MIEFRVLGGVEVHLDGQPVDAGPARQRCVLAVLVVQANTAVPVDQLIDRVWGDRPPARVRGSLHSYVTRLRAVLGDEEASIVWRSGAYVLTVDERCVDMHRFRQKIDEARAAADDESALVLAEEAIGLWRGQPFAGFDTAWLTDQRAMLEQELWAARLDHFDIALRCGRHATLLPRLGVLAGDNPLDERLAGQLMLALYRNGRQADALRAFHNTRTALVDELGVEPGPKLNELYQRILVADLTLTTNTTRLPRQLPPAVPVFTGRTAELAQLNALLDNHDRGVAVVVGTAGVGKTALAVHWARKVANRFPDGQLWINLRGYDPAQPLVPEHALSMVLRALGVPGSAIPVELEEQTGLFRSLVEERRILMVLDNASSADQVRPLLPGSPGCLVLVTSRDELRGLVARDGATRVRLGLLDQVDSIALLRSLMTSADGETLAHVAALCGRLPLALRIAADRLNAVDRPLDKAVADLAEEPRLDAFAAGDDPRTAVRAVFSWSYEALSPPAAALFRRLGLVPGSDWDAWAAAALVDRPLTEARRLLATLAGAHLIQERDGRYHLHDLLRAYAIELIDTGERHAALTRLLDHYRCTAANAMDVAFPHERHRRPRVPDSLVPGPRFADADQAIAWLDEERSNLLSAVVHSTDQGWHSHAVDLASTLYRYLTTTAHHGDAITIFHHAVRSAVAMGDRAGHATVLCDLGAVHYLLARYDHAVNHFTESLTITREIRDRRGEAIALNNLGMVYQQTGLFERAFDAIQSAHAIVAERDDRGEVATALNNLGSTHELLGRYDQAFDHYQQALAIRQEIGDQRGEITALANLGKILTFWKRHEEAAELGRRALSLARDTGNRLGEVMSLNDLGFTHLGWGRPAEARHHYEQAVAMAREIGNRRYELSAQRAGENLPRRRRDRGGAQPPPVRARPRRGVR